MFMVGTVSNEDTHLLSLCFLVDLITSETDGHHYHFGLPDNSRACGYFYHLLVHRLFKWLNRRSGRKSYNWSNFNKMLTYYGLERPRVSKRFIHVDWYQERVFTRVNV